MEKHSFSLDGRIFEYFLKIKDIKSVRLKLDEELKIVVSAPRHVSKKFIENFIYKNNKYIDNKISQAKEINKFHSLKDYKTGECFLFFGETKQIASKKYSKNQVFLENETLYILTINDDHDARKKLFEKFIKKTAIEVFMEIVDEYYPSFSKKITVKPKITIRFMKIPEDHQVKRFIILTHCYNR